MSALIALLGIGTGLGLMLLWSGVRPIGAPADRREHASPRNVLTVARPRFWRSSIAAGVVLLLTRWPVAGIGAGLLGWFASDLLGGKGARQRGVARTEAIATWAEMLRDTIFAAHGLEAAIAATAPVAPQAIRPEILSLAADLERLPLSTGLRRLAAALAHPIADLVVAALLIAANGSVRELADLLGTLATSARDEASMQLRVDAARARMRSAVQVITVCTLAMAAGLVILNPTYVQSYGSPVGQVVLAVILGCWGVALTWLSSMSRFRAPNRFLLTTEASEAVQ